MTAEIGVMNRLGVALAADSAVTIGGDARKVYSSADKLFQLSEGAPVAVMVYGSASFLDRPWETLVKAARVKLAKTRFDTLDGYAEYFVTFLNSGAPVFRPENEKRAVDQLVLSLLFDIREEIGAECDVRAEEEDGLDEVGVGSVCDEVIKRRHEVVASRALLVGFSDEDLSAVETEYGGAAARHTKTVLDRLPMSAASAELLRTTVLSMLIRNYQGPLLAGIVFAGFGEAEYEPVVINYELEERCLGKPRIASIDRRDVVNGRSLIVPFAQKDAVALFMEGIEPGLQGEMQNSVSTLFSGALDALLDRIRAADPAMAKELENSVAPGLNEMLKRLFAGWELMRQQIWRPVLDMVAALPKDELASVAEALVNLTKFRRRVTPVSESVGGPIDVALITKGDGFVWIKRKHYFPAELNPRAVSRLAGGSFQ